MTEKFDSVLTTHGFCSVAVDKCVYVKCSTNDRVVITLYINDMITFGTCINIVNGTEYFLLPNLISKTWMKLMLCWVLNHEMLTWFVDYARAL